MSDSQKTAVIFGLANKRSIAWAIAQELHAAGWQLAITYQNERLEEEAKDLIADLPGAAGFIDRKSTRLNSSHSQISYAVFCLKKKKRRCSFPQCMPLPSICH